jgi:hypothetical protein
VRDINHLELQCRKTPPGGRRRSAAFRRGADQPLRLACKFGGAIEVAELDIGARQRRHQRHPMIEDRRAVLGRGKGRENCLDAGEDRFELRARHPIEIAHTLGDLGHQGVGGGKRMLQIALGAPLALDGEKSAGDRRQRQHH